MKSKRLKLIASFIKKEDKVADIGCDHAYLAIYLKEENCCQKVIATDINHNALKIAQENILKKNLEQEIKTYLSDGLLMVSDKDIDTVVIAGMGSHTILHIIDNLEDFSIKKLIIQTNNNLEFLRLNLRKKGFYLQQEKTVWEKNHYYVVGLYTREYKSLNKRERLYGKYDFENKDYYNYLFEELSLVLEKIKGLKNWPKKIKLWYQKQLLKKYL